MKQAPFYVHYGAKKKMFSFKLCGILQKVSFNLCLISVCMCSVMSDSATPCSVDRQAPLSMGFSRLEYWSGLPFPSPQGSSPTQGLNLYLLHLQHWRVDSLPVRHLGIICLLYTHDLIKLLEGTSLLN